MPRRPQTTNPTLKPCEGADEALREESKSWTPEQWESYLKTLETPRFESLLPSGQFEEVCEELEASVFANVQIPSSEDLIRRVQRILSCLTPRQRQALEEVYLKGKSPRKAALALGISRSAVLKLERKGLKNLRQHILQGVSTLPLVEEQAKEQEKADAG